MSSPPSSPPPPGPGGPDEGDEPPAPSSPYGAYQPYVQPQGQPYGQPYGQSYGQSYGYPAVPGTNGMAIASLVVSILAITACLGAPGFIGAILGHVAKGQIRSRHEQGSGLATAGIVIGWLGTALFVVGVVALVLLGVWADSTYDDCYDSSGYDSC